jgi:hypothetical protein
MTFLRLLPAQFCLLLMAAVFMRLGFPLIMIVPLTVMLMVALLVPWPQFRVLMTIVMGLEACLWGFLTWLRVQERIAYSEPYSRLALILASVALFNVWAAWLVWGGRKAEEREAQIIAKAQVARS